MQQLGEERALRKKRGMTREGFPLFRRGQPSFGDRSRRAFSVRSLGVKLAQWRVQKHG